MNLLKQFLPTSCIVEMSMIYLLQMQLLERATYAANQRYPKTVYYRRAGADRTGRCQPEFAR